MMLFLSMKQVFITRLNIMGYNISVNNIDTLIYAIPYSRLFTTKYTSHK